MQDEPVNQPTDVGGGTTGEGQGEPTQPTQPTQPVTPPPAAPAEEGNQPSQE